MGLNVLTNLCLRTTNWVGWDQLVKKWNEVLTRNLSNTSVGDRNEQGTSETNQAIHESAPNTQTHSNPCPTTRKAQLGVPLY